MDMIQTLAQELNKDPRHVENVVRLLDEGNTIPFIARYRKELHGAMDDTSLRTLEERLQYLRGLEERRDTVKKSIEEQGKLTEELAAAIDSAQTLTEVEDLYRPYKQKRRTRATVAREKGLEPLAALLFAQERDCPRPEDAAAGFIDSEKGVETAADALQGANDIIAEWISDDAAVRKSLRELLERRGTLRSLAATEEDSVYRLYYDFEQSLSRLQGHQILAINRGEKEEKLKVTVLLDREQALPLLRQSQAASILNIASVTAHKGYVRQAAYAASKHAMAGFTKTLAAEVYEQGIRVHLISPGGVFTDMAKVSRPDLTGEEMITAEDIAEIAAFLILRRTNAVIDEIEVHRANKAPFA